MDEEQLFERFPDMKPIDAPPSLSSVNGIGLTLYGRRGHDDHTGTYIKTQWFALLFLPIVAVRAYRVADAPEGGWFFLGKVPVSLRARLWTFLIVAFLLGGAGLVLWVKHTHSPGYQAQQRLREAELLRDQGRLGDAAEKYLEVASGSTEHVAAAVKAIDAMTDNDFLRRTAAPQELARIFSVAWDLRPRGIKEDELYQRALKFVEARSQDGPDACLAVLERVEPAAPSLKELQTPRLKILERLTRERPGDLELLGQLAEVFERSHELDQCEKLLAPHAARLGTTEGARILGQIRAGQGKHDEALTLLKPYVELALKRLHDAEDALASERDELAERVMADIRSGKAPGFSFERFKRAGPDERNRMADEYYRTRALADVKLGQLHDARMRLSGAGNVAFSLAVVQLHRAQQLTDPVERQAELARAEATFLGLRGQKSRSQQYELKLAEVYYWMGKQAEGKKLFDKVLTADGRRYETLMAIATLLRSLGVTADSRVLSEEAYRKASGREQRNQAAVLRGLTYKDTDEQIAWLERAVEPDVFTQALLASARGEKARQEGREEEAAGFYQKSLDLYTSLPESMATLNNRAHVSQNLFACTGNLAVLERALGIIRKASRLEPRDPIPAGNLASQSLHAALRELLTGQVDLTVLRNSGDLSLFAHLWQDETGRRTWLERIRGNTPVMRARTLYESLPVLAPKVARHYLAMQELTRFLEDREGLRRLLRRAEEAKPDLAEARTERQEFYEGKKDAKLLTERQAAVTRAEKRVKAARKNGGATFAAAVASLVHNRLELERLARPEGLDALVMLADEAHRTSPSQATSDALQAALLARASRALAATEREYEAMVKRARRSLDPAWLVAAALWRDGKPRQAALANEDVKRVLTLLREQVQRLPGHDAEWAWAMLRTAHPEEAALAARILRENELLRLDRELSEKLTPPGAENAFRACWTLDSAGKPKEALAELKKAAAAGVPLPFDVP